MTDLNTYFQKHGLCAENILYIYRKDRKTVIQRTDGDGAEPLQGMFLFHRCSFPFTRL